MSWRKACPIYCFLLILISIISSFVFNPIAPDSHSYLNIGQNLIEKGIYSYDGDSPTRIRLPGYPVFLGIFYFLLGEQIWLIIALQTLLNIFSFFFILKIGRLIYGEERLLILPIMLILYVPIWVSAAMLLTESLFIFLNIIFIYFLIRGFHSNKSRDFNLSGLIGALAFLTRGIELTILILTPLIILLSRRYIHRPAKRILQFVLIAILALMPWTVRNYISTNAFTPLTIDGTYNFYYSSLDESTIESGDYLRWDPDLNYDILSDTMQLKQKAWESMKKEPFDYAKRSAKRIMNMWIHFPGTRDSSNQIIKTAGMVVQIGFIVLLIFGFAKTRRPYNWLLIMPWLGYSAIFAISLSTIRFLIPAIPVAMILASRGAQSAINWSSDLMGNKRTKLN